MINGFLLRKKITLQHHNTTTLKRYNTTTHFTHEKYNSLIRNLLFRFNNFWANNRPCGDRSLGACTACGCIAER